MCRMSKFLSDSCAVIKMFDTEASALLTAGPGHPPVNSPQPFLATSGCSVAVSGGDAHTCICAHTHTHPHTHTYTHKDTHTYTHTHTHTHTHTPPHPQCSLL